MNDIALSNSDTTLDSVTAEAKKAIKAISKGDGASFEGWLAYGRALNAGREVHMGDVEFGRWVKKEGLDKLPSATGTKAATKIGRAERSAAMWAAADEDQFEQTRSENPSTRTVRGLYAQHKSFLKAMAEDNDLHKLVDDEAAFEKAAEALAAEENVPANELMDAASKLALKAAKDAQKVEEAAAQAEAFAEAIRTETLATLPTSPDVVADFLTKLAQTPLYAAHVEQIAALKAAIFPTTKAKAKKVQEVADVEATEALS